LAIEVRPLDPLRGLYWSAVLNGVISAPIMVVMMLMATNRQVMGRFVIGGGLKVFGWLATVLMAGTVLAMAVTALSPG
jgi:Mn2+/Fe2+ NRAMP family transporter